MADSIGKTAVRPIPGKDIWRRARYEEEDRVMGEQEMKAAEHTYGGFLGMIKGGAIAIAAASLLVILLIS